MRSGPWMNGALLAALSLPALADDAGLQRCRAIADSAQRLACYDALPIGAPRAAPQAAAPSAPTTAQSLLSRFGFEQRVQPDELPSVESHIPGRFEGWGPSDVIKLANGQAWQIADGSSRRAWAENPKATVRRGALGAFYLEIDRINPSPRVRRVQ
jgi:hypothetical protein